MFSPRKIAYPSEPLHASRSLYVLPSLDAHSLKNKIFPIFALLSELLDLYKNDASTIILLKNILDAFNELNRLLIANMKEGASPSAIGDIRKRYIETIDKTMPQIQALQHAVMEIPSEDIEASADNNSQKLELLSPIMTTLQQTKDFLNNKYEPTTLLKLINTVSSRYAHLRTKNNNSIIYSIPDKYKTTLIHGEFIKLMTDIIENTLSNALDFTFDGMITITITENQSSLLITIQDNGKGMSPEILERIQIGDTVTTGRRGASGGNGVGLKGLRRDLSHFPGAEMTIKSNQIAGENEERGTAVTFKLPLTIFQKEQKPLFLKRRTPASPLTPSPYTRTIMIVDDTLSSAQILEKQLGKQLQLASKKKSSSLFEKQISSENTHPFQCQIMLFETPQNALDYYRKNALKVVGMLVDKNMPNDLEEKSDSEKTPGEMLVDLIRQNTIEGGDTIPIVFVTGDPVKEGQVEQQIDKGDYASIPRILASFIASAKLFDLAQAAEKRTLSF